MITRLLGTIGWYRIANLALLFIVFGSLVWGLNSVVMDLESRQITIIILICVSLVMLLSRLQLSNGKAALVICLSGVIASIYHFAGLSSPLWVIFRSLGSIPQTLLSFHAWPDLTPLALAWQQLLGQLSGLLDRVITWLISLLQGNYSFDLVVISFIWGGILWIITAWATWAVFRLRRPLPGVAPAGILMAGALNYANGNAILLIPFVTAVLLLMALNRYESEEQYWQQNHIDYAEDIRLDMITVIPLLVLGLIILATFTPSLSVKHISRLVNKISEPFQTKAESLADSLGIKQAPNLSTSLDSLRSPGLPQQHLLGSGTELSQQVVMVIQTGDLSPVPNLEMLPHPPEQYYWRSITYDVYTGRGWTTSPTESIQYKADQPAVENFASDNPSVRFVEQSIQFTQIEPGILYAAGLFVTANVDYEVAWRLPIEGTADIFGVTSQALQYQASSLWLTPSIRQLQSAPLVYPDWVSERYLSLPVSLPQRVRDLAMDLTLGQPSPYDQAIAIEAYLRSYPYTLDVPAPPPNQDVADYFLFDLKKGYCDYYATAMVVLSRSVGLPARLVSGFSAGTYDPPNARYVVTANNAHSWVEIYFSGIGWVEFEPTGGLPSIARLNDHPDSSLAILEPFPVQRANLLHLIKSVSWITWIPIVGCILIVIIASMNGFYAWRLQRLSSPSLLAHIYQCLIEQRDRLTVGRQTGDTPLEYSIRLRSLLNSFTARRYANIIFLPTADYLDQLIELYTKVTFSPYPLSSSQHKQAISNWLQLRWRLIAARFLHPR